MIKKILAIFIVFFLCSKSNAIVLHNNNTPLNHPPNEIMGRWSTNASCVAISPNFIITTVHQGGGIGTLVVINGVTYKAYEIYGTNNDDIRVVRIKTLSGQDANLEHYCTITNESIESHIGQTVVLGGFGLSRGNDLTNYGIVYGYTWTSEANTTLRWGTNILDNIYNHIIVSDFDDPVIPEATENECSLASKDSGGGWFIKNGDDWILIALSSSTERIGETWFRDKTNPLLLDADRSFAIEINYLYDQIQSILNLEKIEIRLRMEKEWIYDTQSSQLYIDILYDHNNNSYYNIEVTHVNETGQNYISIIPTGNPLIWSLHTHDGGYIYFGIDVSITGNVGGYGRCTIWFKVEMLGDIDRNGAVEPNDMSLMILKLNGLTDEYDWEFDLDENGGTEPGDMSILINILNGLW